MRLSQKQQTDILEALHPYMQRYHGELRLYGSRVSDKRKGGDIDLLLVLDTLQHASLLLKKKHRILSSIKSRIGDQKIDLMITTQEEIDHHFFLQLIYPHSLTLYQWCSSEAPGATR